METKAYFRYHNAVSIQSRSRVKIIFYDAVIALMHVVVIINIR